MRWLGEGHLEQILDNLIANALDALEAGGTVRVGATEAGGRATIRVADDGRGMTGAQQRAAFRRFASGTPGGTGLGLTIVNRLVLTNAGSAAMSDTPGGGLTVIIDLPLAGPAWFPQVKCRFRRAIPATLTGSERFLNGSRAGRRASCLPGRASGGAARSTASRTLLHEER